ncbi:hypothetical protein [Streptomyces parvus]|nr:hypothetical protein [Streptomyces parvus]
MIDHEEQLTIRHDTAEGFDAIRFDRRYLLVLQAELAQEIP